MKILTSYPAIFQKVETLSLEKYAATRNFGDGEVTYLSPYISRGVISTRTVLQHLKKRYPSLKPFEKFISELAWRDYWQQVWIEKGEAIDSDLKQPQKEVLNHEIASCLLRANTGIEVVDQAIEKWYQTGYMHNHMRLYVASIACNIAKSHWLLPAKWMYYHLLDGDWASNALSWQWVVGSNSNKKYFANQQNINHFFQSQQRDSFLDKPLELLASQAIPNVLKDSEKPLLETSLPSFPPLRINPSLPTCLYTSYNLDPNWHKGRDCNRLFLLEPSHFSRYPIGKKTLKFLLLLCQNIPNMQYFVGEFSQLYPQVSKKPLYFKEHPFCRHYQGVEEARDWMFSTRGYFPSFSAFWKQAKKELCL